MAMSIPYDRIPVEEDFEDTDWLPAEDLEKIADRLIETKPDLKHLYDFQVAYFWKRAGGKKAGQPVMGQCSKVSGKMKAFAPGAHFMVWLAADHAREQETTAYQVEAFVFHELLHTGVSDKKLPVIRPHDWQGFDSELREYGLYYDILQAAGSAFQQLRMSVE